MNAWKPYNDAPNQATWVDEHPEAFKLLAVAEKERLRRQKEKDGKPD
jgi:hypothetical protein